MVISDYNDVKLTSQMAFTPEATSPVNKYVLVHVARAFLCFFLSSTTTPG